jgi:hypothetical protein
VHRLSGKIISSLPIWLLITMMIMEILTRDLACCRRPVLMRIGGDSATSGLNRAGSVGQSGREARLTG